MTRFFNAYIPDPQGDLRPVQLTVEAGVIRSVSHNALPLSAEEEFNCGGRILLPGFIDSHIHLPGSTLYQLYGADLMGCSCLEDYYRVLDGHREDRTPLRGFGWNQGVFQAVPGSMAGFRRFLDATFPLLPVALFSDDYHSCIINRVLEKQAGSHLPKALWDKETGLLREKAVFALLDAFPALSFQREEIRKALLTFQRFLLCRGITALQTLLPIGLEERACFDVLRELEEEGLWKVGVNFSLTAHPRDDPREILDHFHQMEALQGDRVRLHTVKLYIDGVVDNRSAYLSAPYEGSSQRGWAIWENEALEEFCAAVHQAGLQLHFHVIGDAAAEQITGILEKVMGPGAVENRNRHTLAHLQLVGEAARRRIGRLGLLCALQPFWFPQEEYYSVDLALLGLSRTEGEYPCQDLLRRGGRVSFGSDNPVTPDPAPLAGIACAMGRRAREERLSFEEALGAYTSAGAYQLFRENEIGQIAPGFRADFLLLRAPEGLRSAREVASATIAETFVGGERVYGA